MSKEYAVLVKGFTTQEQADAFIKWFEGQGEQDADMWFEECGFKVRTDLELTYPISKRNLDESIVSELYVNVEEV